MYKKIALVIALGLMTVNASAEDAPESVNKLIPTLKGWGSNAALVAAVKKQNAEGMTLDEIKKRDKIWMDNTGVDAFMESLMNNPAAKELQKLEKSAKYYTEIFLMDNQGANVAMSNKTSDYWQGDEPKFTESYKSGAGAAHVGKVKFDDSAQAYLVQVSVPVMDGGKAIGAITIGINVDDLEAATH